MVFKSVNSRLLRAAALVVLATPLFACQPTVDQRGNAPEADKLSQVQVGKTDKATVTQLLGSPSSVAEFDPNVWYYVSAKTEDVAFLKTETLDQNVVKITFDKNNVVQSVQKLGMQDAQTITPNPNATPSRGREFSWIEEFLGNFGRFVSKNRPQEGGGGGY
ncbi:MAG: outer membrane protein assembly factor BamE [Alphaproteobacteria bacterium]|nr:outer membrane protein assembly factor BamE [Alphaproteobacteria bacterium]